jgi:glycosyltransferase involved in cell wall biosynthesis
MTVRIGVDMMGLQSPDSRLRGVGRFGRSFLSALLELDRDSEYLLYGHAGLPTDTFPDAPNARLVAVEPEAGRGERNTADVLNRLAGADPDGLDALLLINPFELYPHYSPPPRALDGPAIVAVVHDLIPFLYQEDYLADPGHARRMYRHLERLREYDLLLTNSEATRADCLRLLGLPGDRVVHVGAAADGGYFHPNVAFPMPASDRGALARLGIGGPFVFCLSGMDDRKNWAGLIDAFAMLPGPLRCTHQLVIACSLNDAYAGRIRRHADSRGVGGRLVLADSVDDATLRTLYRRCAAFAFPSLYEGFGLPLLEAMHCGAAVVAGNNSSQVEVVGDAGLLANVEDAADLASRLGTLLTDPALAGELRARAASRAARFSWHATAARALDAIGRAVAPPAEPIGSPRRRARPRIAMFSPWPPKASGISDYALRLVEELSGDFAVDLYHETGYVPEVALGRGDFGCFDARLFPRNARAIGYRGVVHQMGNSWYHRFVWEAMQRHRGVVVQHDFLMAGYQFWYAHVQPDPWGYLRDEVAYNYPDRAREYLPRLEAWSREPGGFQEAMARRGLFLNRRVFECAEAVVVHSPWCREQAARMSPEYAAKTLVIPHGSTAARVPPDVRAETRARFGLPQGALIVGSFGLLTHGKMNPEALRAFGALARIDPTALFLFVGADWGEGQARRAAAELGLLDRVRFLGRQPADSFDALLTVADIGISLRRPPTYGETSGALLHLLRHGVPTIVNDVGTFADYPDSVVRKVRLEDGGPVDSLTSALLELAASAEARQALGRAAHRHVAAHHPWPLAASLYADLIERLHRERRRKARARHTIPSLSGV